MSRAWKRAMVAGAGVVAIGGALRWFDLHPVTFDALPEEHQAAGERPPLTDRGDVLVLLDLDRIDAAARANSFAAADFSCAWLNLLEAELGPCSIALVGQGNTFPLPPLESFRAVVVTGSALASADRAALDSFARAGGTVFLDGPPGQAGAAAAGFTPLEAGLLPGAAIHGSDQLAVADAGIAADFDPPLLLAKRDGLGRVLACDGDRTVARTYATMLQGRPARDDFTLVERLGDYPGIIEPDDLVPSARYRENEIPFADLYARAIVTLLDPDPERTPPLPRLLWFPAGSNGAFLMTHDEDLRGGAKSLALVDRDRELGVKGTVFAIGHPRMPEDWSAERDFPAAIAAAGGATGLHWNQFPQPRGLGPIEPIQYVMTCARQMEWLRSLSPATRDARTNRNHYLILRPHWSETFRILAAQGVRLDSTFGANKGRGYLFGTARPYRILDANGLPLPLFELPFVNQEDWGGADIAYFKRLLTANAARHKGAIVSLFHPHLIVETEPGRFLIQNVAATALESGHRPMTCDEMLAFWDARRQARVRSTVEGEALRIQFLGTTADTALGVPLVGRTLESAQIDGAPVEPVPVRIGAWTWATMPLPAGEHEVLLRFARIAR